jgi:hypothetical protein
LQRLNTCAHHRRTQHPQCSSTAAATTSSSQQQWPRPPRSYHQQQLASQTETITTTSSGWSAWGQLPHNHHHHHHHHHHQRQSPFSLQLARLFTTTPSAAAAADQPAPEHSTTKPNAGNAKSILMDVKEMEKRFETENAARAAQINRLDYKMNQVGYLVQPYKGPPPPLGLGWVGSKEGRKRFWDRLQVRFDFGLGAGGGGGAGLVWGRKDRRTNRHSLCHSLCRLPFQIPTELPRYGRLHRDPHALRAQFQVDGAVGGWVATLDRSAAASMLSNTLTTRP